MKTFRNKNFTKRDYEATNVVFCQAETNPDPAIWTESHPENIEEQHCDSLWIVDGVQYFGYL